MASTALIFRVSFHLVVSSLRIRSVERAVSIWTFSRKTKQAAMEQKLRSRAHTPLRWWSSWWSSFSTLAEVFISMDRKKKCTGHAKFGGQRESYLLKRMNAGFGTDMGEIMRGYHEVQLLAFQLTIQLRQGCHSTQWYRKKRKEWRSDNMPGVLESLGKGNCQKLGRICYCQIKKFF